MMQWLKDLMASAVQPARAPALEMAGGACGEVAGSARQAVARTKPEVTAVA